MTRMYSLLRLTQAAMSQIPNELRLAAPAASNDSWLFAQPTLMRSEGTRSSNGRTPVATQVEWREAQCCRFSTSKFPHCSRNTPLLVEKPEMELAEPARHAAVRATRVLVPTRSPH